MEMAKCGCLVWPNKRALCATTSAPTPHSAALINPVPLPLLHSAASRARFALHCASSGPGPPSPALAIGVAVIDLRLALKRSDACASDASSHHDTRHARAPRAPPPSPARRRYPCRIRPAMGRQPPHPPPALEVGQLLPVLLHLRPAPRHVRCLPTGQCPFAVPSSVFHASFHTRSSYHLFPHLLTRSSPHRMSRTTSPAAPTYISPVSCRDSSIPSPRTARSSQ